jgi:ferredoxin-NADP reductase
LFLTTVTIKEIREEIKGFKSFVFEEGHDIAYKAGQYLTFIHQTEQEEIRRSYSITSSPALNEPLTIGVKRIENGFFSRRLVDSAKQGDQLVSSGAGGFFTLPEPLSSCPQLFFFAAGSGITPVYSLIKTALYTSANIEVVLVYSSPSPAKTIFHKELTALAALFPGRFILEFLFSNSPDLTVARLNRDLLPALVHRFVHAPLSEVLFYICGPEPYMRLCLYTLREEGIPDENIRRENFIIARTPPPKAVPPDRSPHLVNLVYGGKEYAFAVQYPDTILQAAKKQGILMPYSCEVGRCGNCVAKCTKGSVWLSYNEVLTEKELARGLTLTCVGYPVGGDIQLEL